MNISFKVYPSKKKYKQIHLRFQKGKAIDYTTGTEIYIKSEHWNFDKKELKKVNTFKNYHKIKKKLLEVELAVYEAYPVDFMNGKKIDSDWLSKIVLNVFKRPNEIKRKKEDKDIYFFNWAIDWIEKATNTYIKKNEKIFSETDKKVYLTAIEKLGRFEKYSNKRYKFSDYNKKLKIKYKQFLVDKELLSTETIKNVLIIFSKIYKIAINSGIELSAEWDEINNNVYNPNDNEVDLVYLDESEINKIFNVDFEKKDKYLDKVRDTLIIGLRSGLRSSEYVVGLNESHLKTGKILCTTQKTKTKVVIPIHPQVRHILYKWGGLPPKINKSIFNSKIKEVVKRAGINEKIQGGVVRHDVELWDGTLATRKVFGLYEKYKLVSSHTARRSFATNLYLQGVDNQTIMQVGGWASESMMLHYVKQYGNRAADLVAENWNMKIEPIDFDKLKKIA